MSIMIFVLEERLICFRAALTTNHVELATLVCAHDRYAAKSRENCWRRPRYLRFVSALHCILFDEVLVLLQKQDEKYVLKCQGAQADKATGGSHAPFIRMDGKVIVRNVATGTLF